MTLVARSCVKPSLLRTILFRGTWLGACGIFLIIATGTLLPYFLLYFFGLPLLLLGFTFIGLGLVPYRRLTKLEVNPYELIYENETHLVLSRNQKPMFKIPTDQIEKIDYMEKERFYGIAVQLKPPMKGKVIVCGKQIDLSPFVSPFQGYDLFLPFFTKSANEEVEEFLEL